MFRRMTRERYLSETELASFMRVVRERRHVNAARDHALFGILSELGIRPSEALGLTRADVHDGERPAWIRVRRMKKRKAIPEIDDIEISDRLAVVVASHLEALSGDPAARVFVINRRSLQRRFKMYAQGAGLARHWHLYVLRHTAATRMYLATRDINMVQAMLGHENPDTSSIYAHIPRSLLINAIHSLPAVV